MKKLLFNLIFLAFIFSAFSQSLSLSNAFGPLNPGDTVSLYIPNDVTYEEHVYVTNNSAAAIDVKVRKHTIVLLTGADNTFCWGQCFSPTTEESPYPISIGSGATNTNGFYADYNANGENGVTIVRYTFFDADNLNDTIDVVLKFHTSPTSVQESGFLKAEISNPYPNPSASRCQFSYVVPMTGKDSRIVILDLTGNMVFNTPLLPGEGKITVDVSSLASGIYFYSLWVNDKAVTTRKMIVQR
jgi:hypothetical protein